MANYEEECEALYSKWLSNEAPVATRGAEGFSFAHAPEPYLRFGTGDPQAIWVTTNPGEGFDYQLRPSENCESIYAGVSTYAEAAKVLGAFYSSARAPINAASRANIASMIRISNILGAKSVIQVEMIPWHSRSLSNKEQVEASLLRYAPSYASYHAALRSYLAHARIVLGWAAGIPDRRAGAGMEMKARMIGLDLKEANMVPLEGTKATSQAFFWVKRGDNLRGLFVTQGSATLPSSGLNRKGQRKDELIGSLLG